MVKEPKADLKLKANQRYVKNIIFANSVTDSSKHLPVPKTNTLIFFQFSPFRTDKIPITIQYNTILY